MLRNIKTHDSKKKRQIKAKSTPLEPSCLKRLCRKLSVPWFEQQGKYFGLKIKKSGCLNGIFFFLFSFPHIA
jgi:hypothetical protein